MRSDVEFRHVQELVARGQNDCAISRLTGVPRTTILNWRLGQTRTKQTRNRFLNCPLCHTVPLDGRAYAYLLGLYLGDGYISPAPRGVYHLRIALDQRYAAIIAECAEAMRRVRSSASRVGLVQKTGCVEVSNYWKHWPCLFPQHGPGRKHLRRIRLEPWQEAIASSYPDRLLRGFIHSDGCRTLNRVKGNEYPRYMFTNHSEDIRRIFCWACDLFGIAWRPSNWKTISVARRADVARLDSVIGPKTSPVRLFPP
jgi:hypothetical protein